MVNYEDESKKRLTEEIPIIIISRAKPKKEDEKYL